jgi:hypothetical protein
VSKSENVKAIFEAFIIGKNGEPSLPHVGRCVKVWKTSESVHETKRSRVALLEDGLICYHNVWSHR